MVITLCSFNYAWSDEVFFQGKRITILIGTGSGGSMVSARLIGEYLGKYIPGNPSVFVQPMIGGAHMAVTNHVFNVAKPDGLTLLAANPNVANARLVNNPALWAGLFTMVCVAASSERDPADKQRNVHGPFLPRGSSTCVTLIATVSSALQPLKPLQLA